MTDGWSEFESTGEPTEPATGDGSPDGTGDVATGRISVRTDSRNTDRANALELARRWGDRLTWTPQGWLSYDGHVWHADDKLERLVLVGRLADELWLRSRGEDGDERDITRDRVARLESASGAEAALRLTQPLLARQLTDFDRDPWLLNTPSGTLNLAGSGRPGEVSDEPPVTRPHRADDLITRSLSVDYDPEAYDDVLERVLTEALDPARRETLRRVFGLCLTGHVVKRLPVLFGPTNTAKSTLTEPLLRLLGDAHAGGYATTWDAEVLQADARVNLAEKLHKSRGARLVVADELSRGSRMRDGLVKQITGGDHVDARPLYGASYSYRPTYKLLMASNYVPTSRDPAVHGRLLLLHLTHVPERPDPAIKEYLESDPGAQRALLAWAIGGLRAWQRDGLGDGDWHTETLGEYVRTSDPLTRFLEERCEVNVADADSSTTGAVHTAVQLWWVSQVSERPPRPGALRQMLVERGFPVKKVDRRVGKMAPRVQETAYAGLRVRSSEA